MTVRHVHVGPPGRPCAGCFREIREDCEAEEAKRAREEAQIEDQIRSEFWARVLTAGGAVLALGLALLFCWILSKLALGS